jgi:hypothetical protein
MCDPIMGATLMTLPGLGAVSVGSALAVGGGIVSAMGAIQSGNAQAKMAEHNANATLQQAKANEDLQRRRSEAALARGRVAVSASGIEMSGSPLDVMAQSAADAELDALTVRYGGNVRADQLRMQGRAAQSQGYMSAASNLLMGLSSASRGMKPVPDAQTPGGPDPLSFAMGFAGPEARA